MGCRRPVAHGLNRPRAVRAGDAQRREECHRRRPAPSGTITIRLHRSDEAVALAIEDSGPGLSAEVRDNLFTPFFSTKPHGQGIGLTLVQEVLVGHGFDYSLESEPGGPTRFTVTMTMGSGAISI